MSNLPLLIVIISILPSRKIIYRSVSKWDKTRIDYKLVTVFFLLTKIMLKQKELDLCRAVRSFDIFSSSATPWQDLRAWNKGSLGHLDHQAHQNIFPPKNVFSAPQATSQQLEEHCSSQLLPSLDCLDYNSLAPAPEMIRPFCCVSCDRKAIISDVLFFPVPCQAMSAFLWSW